MVRRSQRNSKCNMLWLILVGLDSSSSRVVISINLQSSHSSRSRLVIMDSNLNRKLNSNTHIINSILLCIRDIIRIIIVVVISHLECKGIILIVRATPRRNSITLSNSIIITVIQLGQSM